MKKTFLKSRVKLLVAILLMIFTFSGCNRNVTNSTGLLGDTESEATRQQAFIKTDNNDEQERINKFLELANHDKYITGEIIEVSIQSYPTQSYLIVQCEGKTYRISGSLGKEHEGLQPFLINYSYSGKASDEVAPGWYATVFYDDNLSNGQTNITLPKDIFLSMHATPNEIWDVAHEARITQYLAETLIENFNAIENKKIFTPDEAMLCVAKFLQLENPQQKERSSGVNYYTSGNTEIFFNRIEYNRYFGINRAEAAEVYKDEIFLDTQIFPHDSTIASPFIEYEIGVSTADTTDWYIVDISGEFRDTLTDRYIRNP